MATGAQLGQTLADAAGQFGWRHVHWRPAKTKHGWRSPFTGDTGFPDYVFAKDGDVLALELKGDGDPLRPGQLDWLEALGAPMGGRITGGLVTQAELDPVLLYLIGRSTIDELRAELDIRWAARAL